MTPLKLNGLMYSREMLAITSASSPVIKIAITSVLIDHNKDAGDVVPGNGRRNTVLVASVPNTTKGEAYQVVDGLDAAQQAFASGKGFITARYLNKHAIRKCLIAEPVVTRAAEHIDQTNRSTSTFTYEERNNKPVWRFSPQLRN